MSKQSQQRAAPAPFSPLPPVKAPQNGQWLTPLQFAGRVHLSRNTVYRHIDEGLIPRELVRYAGLRKIFIQASAVQRYNEACERFH